ncbi:hypothetical protein SAMN04488117_10184 [Celeribacter baekdonensis]|uniref:Uncharacterized protein n=1 Tax=Celeribacter baekdonensis TaxID=875171 RepID=A0A1G7FH41_9RHOB|nr:hypothetical protein SAMN04488117_10184 [Celeribacter baekdonensis]
MRSSVNGGRSLPWRAHMRLPGGRQAQPGVPPGKTLEWRTNQ